MKISKPIFCLMAIAAVILFAGLPVAVAMEGLVTWPTEPGARGSIKATGTFIIHERIVTQEDRETCQAFGAETIMDMILRIRVGNSFTYDIVTAQAPDYYCLVEGFELVKQYAWLDFFNSDAVRDLICSGSDCTGAVVHLKRVMDDVWNYEASAVPDPPGLPLDVVYSAVADVEFVVNQTPIVWFDYPPSP